MRRAHFENYGGPPPGKQSMSSEVVEEENDKLTDDLRDKVKALKKVTIDIGQEVRSQNRLLNEMDNDFDKGTGFLTSTMNRVMGLAKSGHHCYILYLILFAMFVFFVLWLIIKTR